MGGRREQKPVPIHCRVLRRKAPSPSEHVRQGSPEGVTGSHGLQVRDGCGDSGMGLD